jgi:hypothetical protein
VASAGGWAAGGWATALDTAFLGRDGFRLVRRTAFTVLLAGALALRLAAAFAGRFGAFFADARPVPPPFAALRASRYFLILALGTFLWSEQTIPKTGAAGFLHPGTGAELGAGGGCLPPRSPLPVGPTRGVINSRSTPARQSRASRQVTRRRLAIMAGAAARAMS